MLIRNAQVYQNATRTFVQADLLIEDGMIRRMGRLEAEGDVWDAQGAYLIPGLLDVHTHGRAGNDFLNCTDEDLHRMARDYACHGVTAVMPTLASATLAQMLAATERINRFEPAADEASFIGVHWEGRYLNPSKRGAHAGALLAEPSAADLNSPELRDCKALHISAAFELDADGSFARMAIGLGATLGLGHTEATYAQAVAAEKNGVTAYTHLYNAMPPLHHREGGAVLAALMGDGFAELICDGIHVCPEMVALAYRNKGAQRLVLISDSMEAAGCPDGEYAIAGMPVTVKDGIARTHEGALAGSTLTLDQGVNNLIQFCNIPLTDAVICATEAPAKEMGVFDRYGSIEEGKYADLLVLRAVDSLDILRVMRHGDWINIKEGEQS